MQRLGLTSLSKSVIRTVLRTSRSWRLDRVSARMRTSSLTGRGVQAAFTVTGSAFWQVNFASAFAAQPAQAAAMKSLRGVI